MRWLFALVALPAVFQGGRRYFLMQTALLAGALLAGVVWLAAPLAIALAWGRNWVWLWLLPTSAAIFAVVATRGPSGEG